MSRDFVLTASILVLVSSAATARPQTTYLKASNADAGDEFGWAVAASGNTLVVGARYERSDSLGVNADQGDNTAVFAGAAYVFVRTGAGWEQQAYLKPTNTDQGDRFGSAVAISGDTIAVGAPEEKSEATGVNGDQGDNSKNSAGAVYVFVRNGTTWSQQAYLKASNTEQVASFGDRFGASVGVSGDTIVVGAPDEDSSASQVNGVQTNNNKLSSGAAYVFVRNGASWHQQAYLKAANSDPGGRVRRRGRGRRGHDRRRGAARGQLLQRREHEPGVEPGGQLGCSLCVPAQRRELVPGGVLQAVEHRCERPFRLRGGRFRRHDHRRGLRTRAAERSARTAISSTTRRWKPGRPTCSSARTGPGANRRT